MAHGDETRLDRLWTAVAETDSHADWLRFYEGFATARLWVPLDGEACETARVKILLLEAGETALAFDTEARFAAFITEPTEFARLSGAELAGALGPKGVQVALNPGVSAAGTVIDAGALNWIAETAGAALDVVEAPLRLAPLADPEPALLEALGTRLAEMGASVTEAWLAAPADGEGNVCVLHVADGAAALADEIAGEIARIGQARSARPFAVAVAAGALIAQARRVGIGLAGHPVADE